MANPPARRAFAKAGFVEVGQIFDPRSSGEPWVLLEIWKLRGNFANEYFDLSNIDPALFNAYDVRGIYGQDLTDGIAYRVGRAAAQYLKVPQIAVGARYAALITAICRCTDAGYYRPGRQCH